MDMIGETASPDYATLAVRLKRLCRRGKPIVKQHGEKDSSRSWPTPRHIVKVGHRVFVPNADDRAIVASVESSLA